MNFTIHGRNLEVTDQMRDYIEKKIGRLDRYLPGLTEVRVEMGEEQTRNSGHRYIVQVTLQDRYGAIVRGEERHSEVNSAVDLVTDKLHRQIGRYKGKRKDRFQRNNVQDDWDDELPDEYEESETEEMAVVRTKRFAMAPMNTQEAIEQMELLGHSFFVFYDADGGTMNVVYRRQDGNYGLIIPELT